MILAYLERKQTKGEISRGYDGQSIVPICVQWVEERSFDYKVIYRVQDVAAYGGPYVRLLWLHQVPDEAK